MATTTTRSTTAYMNDETDSEMSLPGNGFMSQPSKAQTAGESGSGEENVIQEVMGTGESTETEASGAVNEM